MIRSKKKRAGSGLLVRRVMRVCFALLFALYSVSIDGFRWRITIQSFTRSSSVRVLKEGADFEATLKKIIEAVDEGKIDQISQDLDGIRVSKLKELSPVQQLFDNLNDAEVRARVVDPDSFEEITLMMQLRQEMKRAQKSIQSSSSGGKETDMSQLLAELQADVVESNVPSLSLIDEIDRIDGLDEDEDSEEEEEEDVRDDIISPAIPLSLLSSTSPSSSSSSASQDVVYNGKGNDDDMATSSSSKREEFESLLRTAISSTTAAASSSSSSDSSAANREDEAEAMALRQSTVAAVESGNFAALDISSLLGDALNTLSNEMGLDIKR